MKVTSSAIPLYEILSKLINPLKRLCGRESQYPITVLVFVLA
jgi:hypothetical protein